MISETDLAWIAGCIDLKAIQLRETNRRNVSQSQLSLMIQDQDFRIITRLCNLTGIKATPGKEREMKEWMRRPCGEHCAQQHSHIAVLPPRHQWRVKGVSAAIVLYSTLPYMVHHDQGFSQMMDEAIQLSNYRGGGANAVRAAITRLSSLGWEIPPKVQEHIPNLMELVNTRTSSSAG